jgi:hypothetical protein
MLREEYFPKHRKAQLLAVLHFKLAAKNDHGIIDFTPVDQTDITQSDVALSESFRNSLAPIDEFVAF